jgi:hypothetical protein
MNVRHDSGKASKEDLQHQLKLRSFVRENVTAAILYLDVEARATAAAACRQWVVHNLEL